MGFLVRKPLGNWGMEEWNEQTKHAWESCRRAGTRPQVSYFSMPVPQLLPFLLILLPQWSVFPTQSFIMHFCVIATSDSSPPGVSWLRLRMVRSRLGICLGCCKAQRSPWELLECSAITLGTAGPYRQECFAIIDFIATQTKNPGTETSINRQRRDLQGNRQKHASLESHRKINEVTQT